MGDWFTTGVRSWNSILAEADGQGLFAATSAPPSTRVDDSPAPLLTDADGHPHHAGAITGNVPPADPFELIRRLARSQKDPRKALAELVQNSLDAGATHIQIVRSPEPGMTALHVIDDGNGVLPDLSRQEPLAYIATHIGQSRKRNLTVEQRRELMLQGKSGIGLLGFWSIRDALAGGRLGAMAAAYDRGPAPVRRRTAAGPVAAERNADRGRGAPTAPACLPRRSSCTRFRTRSTRRCSNAWLRSSP